MGLVTLVKYIVQKWPKHIYMSKSDLIYTVIPVDSESITTFRVLAHSHGGFAATTRYPPPLWCLGMFLASGGQRASELSSSPFACSVPEWAPPREARHIASNIYFDLSQDARPGTCPAVSETSRSTPWRPQPPMRCTRHNFKKVHMTNANLWARCENAHFATLVVEKRS